MNVAESLAPDTVYTVMVYSTGPLALVGVPQRVPLLVPNCRPAVRFGEIVQVDGASPVVCPVKGCMVLLLTRLSVVAGSVRVMDSVGSMTSMLTTKVAVVPATEVTVTV